MRGEWGAYGVTEVGEGDRHTATGAFYGRQHLGYAGSLFWHRKERGGGGGGGGIQLEMWTKLVG